MNALATTKQLSQTMYNKLYIDNNIRIQQYCDWYFWESVFEN